MKILLVLPNDSLGGAEQYLKMIASYYNEHEVSIFFLQNNKTRQWEDLKSTTKQRYLSNTHELLGVLRFVFIMLFSTKKFDYSFTSHVKTNAYVDVLRQLGIIKSKFHIARESTSIFLRYKGLKLKYYKILYAIGYKKIDLIICQTDVMKNQFVKFNPKISKSTKLDVIPNPIDLKTIQIKSQEESGVYNFDYIVSAGRLIPEKGFDVLIQAFKSVRESYPKLKLVILGSGNELESLKSLATNLNLIEQVVFAGYSDNVYKHFKAAKLCVVSSRIEGFPNVLLQMMSQNTKVVSTLCAGGIDSIPGVFTCKTDDSNLLASTIISCLSEDTSSNKSTFKNYLSTRSIDAFVNTVNNKLEVI